MQKWQKGAGRYRRTSTKRAKYGGDEKRHGAGELIPVWGGGRMPRGAGRGFSELTGVGECRLLRGHRAQSIHTRDYKAQSEQPKVFELQMHSSRMDL